MLGQASGMASVGIPGGQGSVAANLAAGNAVNNNSQILGQAVDQGSVGKIPYVLLGIVVIYFLWAYISQHERIRESLQVSNIAANIHNIVTVTIMAVIGLVTAKLLFTKLAAWDVPGAAWVGQIVAAA